jgi:U4/U6.U5 tri-snRNP-associated protein 1
MKKQAQKRAKMLEEMDQEFSHGDISEREYANVKKRNYRDRDLKGLKVEHDFSSFTEDKQVVLTLKDQDILNDEGDTLVNVNMLDDERYKKNVINRKQNPNTYGYDVYEEELDEFGNLSQRSILKKYDEELEGKKKTSFVIGQGHELQAEERRRQQEIKAKLQNKTLESLNTEPLQLASEYYNETELTKFKKPKKKIKKLRQKLKADDLLDMVSETGPTSNLGSRKKLETQAVPIKEDPADLEDDDLEQILSKARRIKQKELIIKREIPIENVAIKAEVKEEQNSDEESAYKLRSEGGNIVLNQTAEFCRTLGDIPTYGMAGNREDNDAETMDFDLENDDLNDEAAHSQWNAVNPDESMNDEDKPASDIEDVAILDEEPNVATGVAAALQLAASKGYLEKEDSNRPSNTRFAHLQAKHYSIEDKAHGDDDKYNRRDRYTGPLMDFREKDGFKPNVKLEYIDDNGHLLNAKEAFRYLSHKFHGKGPGKNKVEKRLKKSEQEGVSLLVLLNFFGEN